MAATDTNMMLMQMLQRMEGRDKKAEEQRRADLKAVEESAQAAEERHRADLKATEKRIRRDMLRMFLKLERSFPETSEASQEEVLCRQYSEDLPHSVVSSAGRSIGKSRWPRQERNTSITKTEVPKCTVEGPVRVTSASVTSPVTARRAISSPGQESSGATQNIVSSIPQVLKVPSTECLEEDAPVARRSSQEPESSGYFRPSSKCPSRGKNGHCH